MSFARHFPAAMSTMGSPRSSCSFPARPRPGSLLPFPVETPQHLQLELLRTQVAPAPGNACGVWQAVMHRWLPSFSGKVTQAGFSC